MGESVAIDCGIGCGRIGTACDRIACQNAAQCSGGGQGLDPGNRAQCGPQQGEGIVNGCPVDARRKGEAIILQAWRFERAHAGRDLLGFLLQKSLAPHAENPALFTQNCLGDGDRAHRDRDGVTRMRAQRGGEEPDLHRILDRIGIPGEHPVDCPVEQRGIDLGQCDRRITVFKGPDRERIAEAFPQRVQARYAEQGLRTDRAGGEEFPAGLRAGDAFLDEASLGQAVPLPQRAALGQIGQRERCRAAPERADPGKTAVDRSGDVEAVIGVVVTVFDLPCEPFPKRERLRAPGQSLGEAARIAQRKIEADQHSFACRDGFLAQRRDPRHRLRPAAAIKRFAIALGMADPDPDSIGARAGGHAPRGGGPVHDDDPVEPAHIRPHSASTKSAIAAVSSRSKTGRVRSSSGVSEAMARIVGNSCASSPRALPPAWR